MKARITIYVGGAAEIALDAVEKGEHTRSGRINAICERYLAIVRDAMPRFTQNEWLAIFDANNGITSDLLTATHHYTNLWEDRKAVSLKWEIDAESLSERMRTLPLAGRVAIAEAIERYWGGAYRAADVRKGLEKIGVRIAEETVAG